VSRCATGCLAYRHSPIKTGSEKKKPNLDDAELMGKNAGVRWIKEMNAEDFMASD
jgi:hypothetical protein